MSHESCSAILDRIRSVIAGECAALAVTRPETLLDVGCWDGEATERYRKELNASRARGVEISEREAAIAARRGIEVASLDLETEPFPWPDASVDVAVCNQVFEHLKNIFLPLTEIARVLRPGGTLLFSVPNLGALHNRVLLATGRQPTSIRTFGPHVRGFTVRQVETLLSFGGAFHVRGVRGISTSRYGLPAPLASVFPSLAHTCVFVAERTRGSHRAWESFTAEDREVGQQTHYATVPSRPKVAT